MSVRPLFTDYNISLHLLTQCTNTHARINEILIFLLFLCVSCSGFVCYSLWCTSSWYVLCVCVIAIMTTSTTTSHNDGRKNGVKVYILTAQTHTHMFFTEGCVCGGEVKEEWLFMVCFTQIYIFFITIIMLDFLWLLFKTYYFWISIHVLFLPWPKIKRNFSKLKLYETIIFKHLCKIDCLNNTILFIMLMLIDWWITVKLDFYATKKKMD